MILFLLALLLMPSLAHAAYQDPTVISNERLSIGSTKLIFRFFGDAGEPAVTREYVIGPGTTAPILRNWVDATIKELNLMNAAATLPALQPGQIVPRLAPSVVPPSGKQVWLRKLRIYNEATSASLAGLVMTDLSALKADLESSYQTGYLDVE